MTVAAGADRGSCSHSPVGRLAFVNLPHPTGSGPAFGPSSQTIRR
jgi:hypothetical protein